MVPVRSLLLHLVNKSIRICICSSTLTVLAKSYMVTTVLLFTVVTILHFVQWRNYVTIVMCGHHYVLLKNLKHFIRWICIDEFHSFTSVEVWTHEETETCFCFKFSLYWNATCCSRPLLYGYSLCSIFSQPPIPSDWWNRTHSASLPPVVHESAAAWSEHKHFSVSTWFCSEGDFSLIYSAQVVSNTKC